MKLALCTAVALALAAGCSVSHRSGDFACSSDQRCAEGRTCVDGFCVFPADSGAVDTPSGDAAVCPSQCTSCNTAQKTCVIDCAINNGACNQAVTCPTGWNCNVLCSIANQCNSGVFCDNATTCTIACGRQTCKTVTCGGGACNVTCSGNASCSSIGCGLGACNVNCSGNGACGAVSCGLACACDVTCRLGSCLPADVTCKPGCTTTAAPQVCTSTPTGCNSCP